MNIKVKEFIRDLAKYTPQYHATYKSLNEEFTIDKLRGTIEQAIHDVPFYRNNGYKSFLPAKNDEFSISKFPILTKDDLSGREKELVSDRFFKFFLRSENTGGTTGKPLKLYYSPTLSFSRTVYPDMLYKQFVGKPLQLALLRGIKPSNGKLVERVGLHRVVLSSYQLYPENVDTYIKALIDEKITCLLAFPSSITVLAKLINSKYGKIKIPGLKAILASSEIFSKENKEIVSSVFEGVTLIDYYCMSELAAAAYSIGLGNYEFNNNYGYAEFVDTGQKTVTGNMIARIIATSIMNTTMPLIRYDTGDMVEVDGHGNVVSIIGRTADFVLNKQNELMPCIVLTRNKSLENVMAFQYYQPKAGVLEFHILINDRFSEENKVSLLEDLTNSFPSKVMDCSVVVKDKLVKSRAGKLIRLINDRCVNS